MAFVFEVPIETPSVPNMREHWGAKARRTKKQRDATAILMPKWNAGPLLVVTLTRVAPRRLDDDNLRGALKAVRDAVAARLGVDDASPLVRWDYAQETGSKPRVRVEGRPASAQDYAPVFVGGEPSQRTWTDAERAELLPAPRRKK